MRYLSHRLIVLLLLFLQGFTPLVHAHVDATGFDSNNGIHIDGMDFAFSEQSQLSDFDQAGYYPLAIGVNCAIQPKRNADKKTKIIHSDFAISFNFVTPIRRDIEKLIAFSPPSTGFYTLLASDSAPRAPPLSPSIK